MNKIVFLIFFALSQAINAKEYCDPKSVGVADSTSKIRTHFYTGTCHYRNKDYHLSVASWEKLAELSPQSAEDEELKIDVLNNLGYMKFFGYGTLKDQKSAVEYWREAILLGHEEAEYHLCHAYADRAETTFNLAKAIKHCKKARLIYKSMQDSDGEILRQIEKYLSKIDS